MLNTQAIFAGRATFTVHGPDVHYTFKVSKPKGKQVYFVNLLTGPDNLSDYTYIGVLDKDLFLRLTRASRFRADSRPVKAFNWAMKVIGEGKRVLPEGYGINHAGRCMRCARPLTHPDGIDPNGPRYGYGQECFDKIG